MYGEWYSARGGDGMLLTDNGWIRTSRVESVVELEETADGEWWIEITMFSGAKFKHTTKDVEEFLKKVMS